MKSILNISCGISVLDSHYMQQDIAAIYLIKQADKAVLIETGTKYSLPYIEKALIAQGLGFSDVLYVIPTHVHLDHAAGAGMLMQVCKNAKLIVHPRGVRHMVDPNKLITGTMAVYGEQKFKQLYGEIVPIEINRILEAGDGFKLNFNDRVFEFLDTPGHAKHHFCLWDELSQFMFTGDAFGVSYREFDVSDDVFIFPTTTPVQFDPKAMIASIDKIMQYQPKQVCLTHFGAIKPTHKVVKQLKDSIQYMSNLAIKYYHQQQSQEKIKGAIMDYLLQILKKTGIKDIDFCTKKLNNDVELNTQGLIYWQQNQQ